MNELNEQIIDLIKAKIKDAEEKRKKDIECNVCATHWRDIIDLGKLLLQFFKTTQY